MIRLGLVAVVLVFGGVLAAPAAPAQLAPQLTCKYGFKYVTRIVHGRKKRVKVCKKKPPPKPKADLAVTLTHSLDRITVGNQLTYEVTLVNRGPQTAHDVEVSVSFPADSEAEPSTFSVTGSGEQSPLECEGSSSDSANGPGPFVWRCRLSSLAPVAATGDEAGTQTVVLRFVVEPDAPGPFTVEAKGSAGPQTRDPRPANSVAKAVIDVLAGPASADLSVAVATAPNPATLTDDLTMTVAVTNHGPTEATQVQVTALLPLATQLVSLPVPASDESCQYSDSTSTLTLCWPVVQPGETLEQTFAVAPLAASPPTIDTDFVLSAYTPDPNLGDNRLHASTPLEPFHPNAGVDLVAHVGPPQTFEGYVIFPFGIANRGSAAPTNAHAVLTLSGPIGQPALTFIGSIFRPPPIGPCVTSEDVPKLDCLVQSVPSGSRVNGFVYAETSGSGMATATVAGTSDEQDANPADNTSTASISVKQKRPVPR